LSRKNGTDFITTFYLIEFLDNVFNAVKAFSKLTVNYHVSLLVRNLLILIPSRGGDVRKYDAISERL
jgi:hypothetical protein